MAKDVKTIKATSWSDNAFFREFKEFIDRGNVMDLAIGVAVGGAFTAIVNSLVNDMIMPITSLILGGVDFSTLAIDIPNIFGADTTAHIAYGNFLQNVVNFLVVALTVFLIVRTLNRLNEKAKHSMQAIKAKEAAERAGKRKEAEAEKARQNKAMVKKLIKEELKDAGQE